jgi:glycosyltransferase involved in cell wall biosynthesis
VSSIIGVWNSDCGSSSKECVIDTVERRAEPLTAASGLVSVIVPTRDRPERLRQTVKSILLQPWLGEVIVIDDASTDAQAVRQVADLEPQMVRVVRLACSQGESRAVNVGWSLAQYPLVAVVSDDDPQPSDWIGPIVHRYTVTPEFLAYFPTAVERFPNGTQRVTIAQPYRRETFFATLRSPCLVGVVVNRRKVLEFGVRDLRHSSANYCSDLIQWLDLATSGDFLAVPESTAYWVRHSTQMTSRLTPNARGEQLLREVARWHRRQRSTRRIFASSASLVRSIQIMADGNSLRACRALVDAFRIAAHEYSVTSLVVLTILLPYSGTRIGWLLLTSRLKKAVYWAPPGTQVIFTSRDGAPRGVLHPGRSK